MSLRQAWDDNAADWLRWARAPGHDSYWRFHRDAFLSILPSPGRCTADIGCGEGRLTRDLIGLGHRVVSLDASPAMVRATATHPDGGARAVLGDAAALPFAGASVDLAVAFMSLQDVDRMEDAVGEAARVLIPGGRLCLAVVHPANSAGAFEGESGDPLRPFVIRGSWFDRRRTLDSVDRDGFTMTFHSEHRSLQAYADALSRAGLLIERIAEVGDPDPAISWHRMPLFLHLRAVKPR
jgi:SAM-dependent methyltransferase